MPYRFNPLPWRFDRVDGGSPAPAIETLSGQTGTNPVGPDGSFNIDLTGEETTDNNLAGINTRGSSGTNTVFIQLTNRATGALSTNDATPTNIITFPLDVTAVVYSFSGEIVAHNTTDSVGGVYGINFGVITDGATATLLGAPEFAKKFEQLGMVDADVDVTTSGNSVIVQVTGIAAKVVSWLAQVTYKRVV